MESYRLRRGIFPTPLISAEHIQAERYTPKKADGYKVRAKDGHIVYIPCARWRQSMEERYSIIGCIVMTIFGAVEAADGDYIVHTRYGRYIVGKDDFEKYYESEDIEHGKEKEQF